MAGISVVLELSTSESALICTPEMQYTLPGLADRLGCFCT